MASTMVIKVKYGKTLRRFNAPVNEDDELELDMAALRAKVSNLFDFQPDSDFSLTYNDEDDDVVTLVDDEDLRDVMRQQLKFLRIKVQLNNSPQVAPNNNHPQVGRSDDSGSSASSTPPSLPREPVRLRDIRLAMRDFVKSVPEPLNKALVDLTLNLASANPDSLHKVLVELTSNLASKNPILTELADAFGKMTLSRSASVDLKSNSVGEMSSGDKEVSDVPPETQSVASGSEDKGQPRVLSLKPAKNPKAAPKTNPDVQRCSIDLNMPYVVPFKPASPKWKAVHRLSVNAKKEKKKKSSDAEKGKYVGCGTSATPLPYPLDKSTPSSLPGHDHRYCGCPALASDPAAAKPRALHLPFYPYKRHHSEAATSGVFHKGIRCDGCGVHPITGPRFKSKVKENYDLCSVCIEKMGDVAEYTRIDHPMSYHHNPHLPSVPLPPPPHFPFTLMHPHNFWAKPTKPKLDSLFVSDVTVFDGTVMAPSSRFIKIWKMRNIGIEPWTNHIRLVHIGGDKFSQSACVTIGIPPEGIPMGGELDVAIDFVAPESSGQYMSYWMLAFCMEKFGQRVWAQIEVDADLKHEPFPRVTKDPPSLETALDKLFKPVVEAQPKSDIEQKFPINDSLLIREAAAATSSKVKYPIINLNEDLEDEVFFGSSSSATPVFGTSSSAPPAQENDTHKEALLKELADMGFKEVELNREALKMNRYDLEQSVDYLCGVLEWDPILEELEEMGFNDTETNKKLLAKNNGSIKRVVMDLINGE